MVSLFFDVAGVCIVGNIMNPKVNVHDMMMKVIDQYKDFLKNDNPPPYTLRHNFAGYKTNWACYVMLDSEWMVWDRVNASDRESAEHYFKSKYPTQKMVVANEHRHELHDFLIQGCPGHRFDVVNYDSVISLNRITSGCGTGTIGE